MHLRSIAFACTAAVVALVAPVRAQTLEVGANDAIRIEIARLDALVEEGIARVEVDETFRNATGRELEGVYRFRLPEDAVVGAFSMWIDGREKRGRVLDAAEARSAYDAIVRKRRDPGLLEQTGWRDFKVSVFPIAAAGVVRVRLDYAHPLRDDLGLETLELPLPTRCGAVGDLRVHVALRERRGLDLVESPSHPKAAFTTSDGAAEATWSGDGVAPDGPFVVRALAKRSGFDVALLADRPSADGDGWFLARITPRLATPPAIARDVVFVLDRSGSMEGCKLEQARAALLAGLATLRPGDRFEIVSFASDVTALGTNGLLDASPENLARARRAADDLVASGGTNLHGALQAAVARVGGDPDRLSAIVLLTDGDPTVGLTDPARILAWWRESGAAARLFAFGVGDDVKDFLLTKLATEGRGAARYVRERENLELPLAALFDRVKAPLLLDPELEVDGGDVVIRDREPRRLPDLFQGHALLVGGRYRGAGRAVVHLRGRSGGAAVAVDVPLEFPATTPARPHVAQIWAKQRVERLLDDLRIGGPNAELRDEVRRLGLDHQLVTPYTSFLVVEEGAKLATAGANGADDGSRFDRTAAPTSAVDDPQALSDVPTGAADGSAIGLRLDGHASSGVSAFAGRRLGAGGIGRVGGGASASSASGVQRAVEWLARHASSDGSFDPASFGSGCADDACRGRGAADHAVEATGLAVLAALGQKFYEGRFDDFVVKALKFLSERCDADGALTADGAPDRMPQQALGALALTEASAISGSTGRLRDAAALAFAFALAARDADGAWSGADGVLDLETTAWMVELLRSASSAKLDVPSDALARIARALESRATKSGATRPSAEAAEAIGLLIRLRAGASKADLPIATRIDRVVRGALGAAHDPETADVLFWHFGALALQQVGGTPRQVFATALRDSIVAQQVGEKSAGHAFGSWAPTGPDGAALGRVATTALNALTTEVLYEYPRTYALRRD